MGMRLQNSFHGLCLFASIIALAPACESPTPAPLTQRSGIASAGVDAPPPAKKGFDGLGCMTDDECESGHCNNRVCCAKGDCCKVTEDCALDTKDSVVCEDSATCQGSRGTVACNTSYRCVISEGGTPDDSGCTKETEASDCGFYKSAFCNGTRDQREPTCPTACTTNDDCDMDAHCAGNQCIANLPDGGACTADGDCMNGHCNHGFCCAKGDCCAVDTDCDPAMYSAPPSCTDMAMCQGARMVPACVDSMCEQRMEDDDTACDRNVIANACGDLPVKCRGGADQKPPPPCATGTCGGFAASTCNEGAFCWQNRCQPDQPDGESCTNDASCQSGHCQNNVCCSEGECCTSDDQCPPIGMCMDARTCQGKRQDRHCDVDHGTCANNPGMLADDDSSCSGRPTGLNCNLNFARPCTAAVDQQPPSMENGGCIPCTTTPVCPPGAGALIPRCGGCAPNATGPMTVDGEMIPAMCGTGITRPNDVAVGCSGVGRTCTGGVCQ